MTVASPDNLTAGMSLLPEARFSAAKPREEAMGNIPAAAEDVKVAFQKSRRFTKCSRELTLRAPQYLPVTESNSCLGAPRFMVW